MLVCECNQKRYRKLIAEKHHLYVDHEVMQKINHAPLLLAPYGAQKGRD